MKSSVFKYFDEFCFGELIVDVEDRDWVQPNIPYEAFGYDSVSNTIFYNGELERAITSTFGINSIEFKDLMRKWFEDRYNLTVSNVM